MTAQSFLDDTALKHGTLSYLFTIVLCSVGYLVGTRREHDDVSSIFGDTPSFLPYLHPRERVESPTASTRPLLLYYIMFYDDAAPSIYDAAPLTLLRLFYSTSLRYEVERSDTILRRGWPNGAARSPDLVSRGESHPIPIFFKFSRARHLNIIQTAVACSVHRRTLWRR